MFFFFLRIDIYIYIYMYNLFHAYRCWWLVALKQSPWNWEGEGMKGPSGAVEGQRFGSNHCRFCGDHWPLKNERHLSLLFCYVFLNDHSNTWWFQMIWIYRALPCKTWDSWPWENIFRALQAASNPCSNHRCWAYALRWWLCTWLRASWLRSVGRSLEAADDQEWPKTPACNTVSLAIARQLSHVKYRQYSLVMICHDLTVLFQGKAFLNNVPFEAPLDLHGDLACALQQGCVSLRFTAWQRSLPFMNAGCHGRTQWRQDQLDTCDMSIL